MPDESRAVLSPGVDLPPTETVPIPIEKLKHADWNPKTPIHGEYKRGLEASIEEFGFDDALKVWPDPDEPGTFIVLNGNQRLTLLREGGVRSVHCEVKADLDRDGAKLYTASRDRSVARYDEAKLAVLAGELKARGAELVSKLLRPDMAVVAPPPPLEPLEAPAAPRLDDGPTIPLMVSLTREGYREVTAGVFRAKGRLMREDRLREALASLSERAIDDLVVELALRVAAK
jgi:uncharacterized protein YjiS (DUF1127 family)